MGFGSEEQQKVKQNTIICVIGITKHARPHPHVTYAVSKTTTSYVLACSYIRMH